MKKWIPFLLIALLAFSLTACGTQPEAEALTAQTAEEVQPITESTETEQTAESIEAKQTKILVAYFSATGNTKPIAETIAELTGGDLFEIVPAQPYTDDDLNYSNDSCRANQEQDNASARPEISGTVENMEDYDIVLLGHPIWWGKEPRIMDTFLESYDFSGKTVVNFCTSGGSGISTATENLKALSPDANWLEGHRFATGADSDTIQTWLDSLGVF